MSKLIWNVIKILNSEKKKKLEMSMNCWNKLYILMMMIRSIWWAKD